ncbi:MAG TPA: nitrilase-related carbon-nitrogen hydrolase [Holophagaceae bacterium]|nr:nitrilase-related carbon-nitrogen hydrolase [Holophagaceae bacterium]
MERIVPPRLRRALEALALGALFFVTFAFPGAWGGWLEVGGALLFPILFLRAVLRGRPLPWAFLALLAGLVSLFHWVPRTLVTKGGLSTPLAYFGSALLWAWEAGGLLAVAAVARWMHRRAGAWGAAFGAALAITLWEGFAFHVYPWHYGSALGGLPLTAKAAAFLGVAGFSALLWGSGAWAGACLAEDRRAAAAWGPRVAVGLLILLGLGWRLLPREPRRDMDIVMIQPDFVAGERFPGMEAEMWRRSDPVLQAHQLPRPGVRTLLLWPESSVLGRDDRLPDPRLAQEASRRGVAWLFGTEGGLFNLVRGEVDGRPPFIQAKVHPMAFGERMPGPDWLRHWLDERLGFLSQEPGELSARSVFVVPTPQGEVRVAPLICSEALEPERTREGLAMARANLLSNHTNDGWFERSMATDLHAAQIRLRAPELGVPLLRATLTGKSGVFHEDGSWQLWGEAMSEDAYAFSLRWSPIRTPARGPWPRILLLALLGAGSGLLAWRGRPR